MPQAYITNIAGKILISEGGPNQLEFRWQTHTLTTENVVILSNRLLISAGLNYNWALPHIPIPNKIQNWLANWVAITELSEAELWMIQPETAVFLKTGHQLIKPIMSDKSVYTWHGSPKALINVTALMRK